MKKNGSGLLNPKKMYITIKDNALDIYKEEINYYKRVKSGGRIFLNSIKWMEYLSQVEGQTIEVETDYLFNDQFNTVPIQGVSEQGLRIMDDKVLVVINDQRIGKGRCNFCGKTSNIPICDKGCDIKYFTVFGYNPKDE